MDEPWTAYCCGITFDEELGNTSCELSLDPPETHPSILMSLHDEKECGVYRVEVTPVKVIKKEDRDGYLIEYDYEMADTLRNRSRDDRIVYMEGDRTVTHSCPDVYKYIYLEDGKKPKGPIGDCMIAKVMFKEVLIDGKLANRKRIGT